MANKQAQPVLELLHKITRLGHTAPATDAQLLARFVAQHDEHAFALLVQRHGPLVLGVCRRVLKDRHDADDAYQATFLVLARKAGSIGRPEALGNWLYGVAYRTALKVRAEGARRRAPERQQFLARAGMEPVDELILQELRCLLDEEVSRLPAKYRMPFVLCYLSGQTHEEAAQTLGCPRKTITTRLARARERLHTRLVQRGLTLSAATLATILSENLLQAAGSAIPTVDATARAAIRFVTGKGPGLISVRVVDLTKGVLTSMTMTKLHFAIVGVLCALLLGSGAGVLALRALASDPHSRQAVQEKEQKKEISDKDRLQGTWVATSVEVNGQDFTAKKAKNWSLVFEGDKVQGLKGGKGMTDSQEKNVFALDSKKDPKEIDLRDQGNEVILRGIYELDGDVLKVCWPADASKRPTGWSSTDGVLATFQKKKGNTE